MSLTQQFKKLTPLLNRVLIKKLEPVNSSKTGIIMSTKAENPNIGKIIAVGEGNLSDNGKHLPI